MSSDGLRAVDHEVAVVGAGLTGICAGIKLGEAGIDFAMIERADDIGGTWRDCTYPGIAVDVPSAHYSLSFEPNPDWSRTYAPGHELKAYADRARRQVQPVPQDPPEHERGARRLGRGAPRVGTERHRWGHSRALHPQLQWRADRPECRTSRA